MHKHVFYFTKYKLYKILIYSFLEYKTVRDFSV